MSSTGMRKINIEIQGKVGKVNIEYEVPKTLASKDLAMEVKYIMNDMINASDYKIVNKGDK